MILTVKCDCGWTRLYLVGDPVFSAVDKAGTAIKTHDLLHAEHHGNICPKCHEHPMDKGERMCFGCDDLIQDLRNDEARENDEVEDEDDT